MIELALLNIMNRSNMALYGFESLKEFSVINMSMFKMIFFLVLMIRCWIFMTLAHMGYWGGIIIYYIYIYIYIIEVNVDA
jgi:hypothetical protein